VPLMSSLLQVGQAIKAMGVPVHSVGPCTSTGRPVRASVSGRISGRTASPAGRVAVGQMLLASHVATQGGRGDAGVLIRDGPRAGSQRRSMAPVAWPTSMMWPSGSRM
jgi:hypothetical protein